LIEQIDTLRPDPDERKRRDAQPPVLLVLPGSRRSEIRHHMAVFGETLGRLQGLGVGFELVLATMPHLQDAIAAALTDWAVQPRVVVGEADKRSAFRLARAAFAKSGTVTLELAISGVPMVAAYKAGAVEAWIVRRRITSSSVILANLVIGENVVPEFIQEDCTPLKLAPALRDVLLDTPLRQRQVDAFARIDTIMSTGQNSPSVQAADVVLARLRTRSG
jgi:lipid-A-disaccharide synthase